MSNQHPGVMEALNVLTFNLRIAESTNNRQLAALAHSGLGDHYCSLGQYDTAIEHHKMSLTIAKLLGDKEKEGAAYGNLGSCYHSLCQYDKAIEHHETSLTIAKQLRDKEKEGAACDNLGSCYYSLCQYDKATEHQEMCLTIAKQMGDKRGEGSAYGILGICYHSLGQYNMAIKHQEMCLTIAKQLGDKQGEGAAYGNLGICYHFLGQYDKAIEHQEMCLTIAKQIGDKRGEGSAYRNLGICYHFLGQYNKAIKHQEMCLTIAKQLGEKQGEGAAYGNLGSCYCCLGQYEKAIEHHEMSLTIAKQIGDKQGEGASYGNLGSCYHSLGQYDKAKQHHEMSLTIAKQIGDERGEGVAYGNLGNCYWSLCQYDKAIKHHEMSLTVSKQIGDKQGEGASYGSLGICYHSLGQYEKVKENHEMSLTIAKQIGDKQGEGASYGRLGSCYHSLGQYDKAKQHHEMSLTIAKQIGDKQGERAAYGNLGSCYCCLGQHDKAIEHNKMSLTIAKQIRDKQGEGGAYGNLGSCYCCLGQYDKAIEHHKMSLTIAKQIGDKQIERTAYGDLGNCCYYLDQYDKAIEHHENCLTISKRIGDKRAEGIAYYCIGTSYYYLGQYEDTESSCRKSVECFEKLFENVPKLDELKVSICDAFNNSYSILIKTLLLQGKANEALVVAENGRSRALAELMLTTHHIGCAAVTEAKISDIDEVHKVVKTLGSTIIFFLLLISDICTWIIQTNGDVVFEKGPCEVSAQSSKYYTRHHDLDTLIHEAVKVMETRCAVKSEDRSLSFLYSEDRSRTIEKAPRSSMPCTATPADLAVSQPGVTQDCSSYPSAKQRKGMTMAAPSKTSSEIECSSHQAELGDSMLNHLLKDLYHILLEPVRQYVTGSQAIVVADGPLAMVPFAALIDENGHYLTDSLQVRLVPSLATAKMIKERPEELPSQGCPLIIGDPDVGEVKVRDEVILVPRLPHANKEAHMVSEFLGVQPLTAEKATKENFLQNIESANLIHIAAHGNAERGEILLAPCSGVKRSNVEDVMLTMSDLEGKHMKAKLVVLSCCHTGRGDVRAEGLVGMARAFLGAGARAVLVTLWAIDDAATLQFMRKFYQHLIDGESASKALNRAMKAMRESESFRHPGFWAPFVLVGEDVNLFGM